MNLQDYLKNSKTTQASFARKLGVTQGLVHQWIYSLTPVSIKRAQQIHDLTDGKVDRKTLNDFFS